MADHNERWVLNHLIEMCRDEELALRAAADHVRNPAVKTLLVELASERGRFASDLLPHAQRLGGADATDGTARNALHRRWMTVKAALFKSDDQAMITEAEHSEALALCAYEEALEDMLPPTTRDLVEHQCDEIRRTHDRVRGLLAH